MRQLLCDGFCLLLLTPYLGEDGVDGHLLLEEAAGEVHLGRDVTAVNLDLADVRLLLPQLNKPDLSKYENKINEKILRTFLTSYCKNLRA